MLCGADWLFGAGWIIFSRQYPEDLMNRFICHAAVLAALLAAGTVWAGGSGLNVIVVVNQNSTNSVQLGNDYCEQRGVPPQNLLRMTGWTGGSIELESRRFSNLPAQSAAGHGRQPRADQSGAVCAAVHGHSLPRDGWHQPEQHHLGAVLRVQDQHRAGGRHRLLLAAGQFLQQLRLLRIALQPGDAEHGQPPIRFWP